MAGRRLIASEADALARRGVGGAATRGGVGVRILIDRPGLAQALAVRGIGAGDGVLVVPAATMCRWRAATPAAKILALAADRVDEARALDAGADDAIAADAPDALVAARVARLLRGLGTTVVGELVLDRIARTARRAGIALDLLPREYALLDHLARCPGRTVARDELLAAVLGRRFDPGTNVLTVHLSRLRASLDRGFAWPMLLTDRGRGYRLVAAPEGARYAVKRPT